VTPKRHPIQNRPLPKETTLSPSADPPRAATSSPPSPVATALATVVGNLYLALGSTFFSLLTLLVSWIPPRTVLPFAVARLWARGVLLSSGVRLDARYDPTFEPEASYVFLSNHSSLMDIPVVIVGCPGQVRLVAKRSLFQIPIFGWAMTAAGFVSVDRKDRSSARETFAAASDKLKRGISILLFPEGTRGPGDVLLPFQRGGFLLALRSGLPIVPVGIRGSRAVRGRENFLIHPQTVEVRFGAPIDPGPYGLRRKKELVAEVRRQIAELAGVEVGDVAEV
jgi:1-acyl-sn-glycerol-3-phosphate acyltransferase